MCSPAIVGAVAAVGSAAVGGYSAIQSGRAQKKATAYNARVAENEAVKSRNIATEKENIHREKVQQLVGKQRAQAGAAGVDLGFGSAFQLQEDTEIMGEADALRIRDYGDSQVQSLQQQSMLQRYKGDAAVQQGYLGAGGSLLQGVGGVAESGVADKWFKKK